MKTITKKSTLTVFAALASLLVASFLFGPLAQAAVPNWDVTGSYVVAMSYQGNDYAHDMVFTQDGLGNLDGTGGSPAGAQVHMWDITSGTVSGDVIEFYANYTATPDAVVPQTVMHVIGTIANDGSMSGTWTDNYQGGARAGTWATTDGTADALAGSLAAEDFGVVNYDTGLGMLKGYSAGFGLTDATFENVQSVEVKLYAGATLLQTNTATANLGDLIVTQISSPFDVSGNFDYVTDGYWTNVREAEYGQSVPATRVVAIVTLENGKVVTAENTLLAGDPTTIYPPVVDEGPTTKDDCKNNGWKTFTNPSFKNQGQCVASVAKAQSVE